MSLVADQYTDPLVELWCKFRDEVSPGLFPDPSSTEEWSEMKGPSETLDDLWSRAQSEKLGSRGDEILGRVRNWLHGAEQSSLEDRHEVEALFERCTELPELARWRDLAPSQREQILDQLLRTLSGVSATILDQKPRTKTGMEFTILWQKDGNGIGRWKAEVPMPAFSLAEATCDVANLYGHFSGDIAVAVTKQILHDLRSGELAMPLLVRSRSSTEQTRLRPISPGKNANQGLVLPERVPTVDDEIALRQTAPRVWRVYDEALVLAGKEHLAPFTLNWDDIDVTAATEPTIHDAGQLAVLCTEIEKATPMSRRVVCTVLGTPLKFISQKSVNPALQLRALGSLAALRDLLNK